MSKLWYFARTWNDSLKINSQRELVERDHVWASELGGSYYERYHKMTGREPTTPPNLRSRRKFEGGNLTEWIVLQILLRAGVVKSTQEYITYDGVRRVTGKADFTVGGQIKLLSDREVEDLPETFGIMAEATIANLKERYPDGLRDMNLEVKSCSGIMFERYMKAPSPLHGLQAFHYAYNTKKPTMLVYVSRDDFRIAQWIILPGSKKWLNMYETDLAELDKFFEFAEMAKKKKVLKEWLKEMREPLLVWDEKIGKFQKNWKIEYSNWLTDYGYKKPDAYAKPAQSAALRLSNIVTKIRTDKPINGKVNVQTLKECYEFYPEAEIIINKEKEKYANKH